MKAKEGTVRQSRDQHQHKVTTTTGLETSVEPRQKGQPPESGIMEPAARGDTAARDTV